MAGFSHEEITEFYNAFKSAYLALSSGVSGYTINVSGSARSVTRAELPTIKTEMIYWKRLLDKSGPTAGIKAIPVEHLDN